MKHESPQVLKQTLSSIISEMQTSLDLFVKQPGKDFARNRRLTFSQTVNFFLSMGGNTVRKELLEFFDYSSDCVSASAFSQQRAKILPEAMDFLFHSFTESFKGLRTYHGYRLVACDGSDLAITYNPKDIMTYRRHNSVEKNEKGYNQLHLNALYDLENRIYLDTIIQPGRHPNEAQALIAMMERSNLDEKTILIADRGYESYNILAHAQEKGWKYLIRIKDLESRGIITNLPLPDTEEFDCKLSLVLTKKQTKEVKAHPEQYRYLTNKSVCDFLDPVKNPFYTLFFRVLRFPITQDTYECIITNLDLEEFPPEEIKKLYGWRWGIERSFRELKYTIGLTNFHAKKVEYILQEIFARLIIYNFCERVTTGIVIQQKNTKYIYQINFAIAVMICKQYFKDRISPPTVEALIQKNVLPVREGRKAPRKVRPNSAVSFLYRIA
jgi:hypothetical protein